MIRFSCSLSSEGVIEEMNSFGHSGFQIKGTDIVCSAFSVLLRTFVQLVESDSDFSWISNGAQAGSLHFRLQRSKVQKLELYRGWCWFLLRGIEDLARDFPENVKIEITETSGRLFHGT